MPEPSALRLRIFLPVMSIVLPGVMNPSVRPVAESVTRPMRAPPESSTLPEKTGTTVSSSLRKATEGLMFTYGFCLAGSTTPSVPMNEPGRAGA